MRSRDAVVLCGKARWTMRTGAMERVVALDRSGRLMQTAFRDVATGRSLGARPTPVFAFAQGDAASAVSSGTGGWRLLGARALRLKQGEIQLDIEVSRQDIAVRKTYVVYPGSSVVREWVTVKNAGAAPVLIGDPAVLELEAGWDPAAGVDLHWMTGGENQPGSWVLHTETVAPEGVRAFDSYDAFPLAAEVEYPGDGIDAAIRVNDQQVWPASGWQTVANANVTVPFDFEADVKAGDRIAFLVNMRGGIGFDTTSLDPTIRYADGETHVASREFSDEQGRHGWRYQYLEAGEYHDLAYYGFARQWRKKVDNATGTPFVSVGAQHPDVGQDAARVWTAPRAGRVRITGTVCNTGNPGGGSHPGFRMGSSTYAPWCALAGRDAAQGVFVSWDYFGHWASKLARGADGVASLRMHVAGHRQTLAPGESLTTPKALTGLYHGDIDNAGNACLDWQYRYLWDYTREPWFPAIRMLGYWMRGTGWGQEGVSWTGGNPDLGSTFRKVFRVADLMRSVGADVYHRDWGWWDRAGDWNGPDFRSTIAYLAKHGMGQLIYAFLYTVDMQSKVAREHPDWVLASSTLDMSKPEVVDFMVGQLDRFRAQWGPFEWRNDSTPTAQRGSDDTPLLGQDAGLREVIRRFLDAHPDCAFQAVNGGGNNAGIEYARMASAVSFSDGAVGIIRNHWASLILPPDKTSDIPDVWNPNAYDPAVWRGLLTINFDMTGDTWEPAKVEGLRLLIDIYHYLAKHGVVGRWVRVYRPVVQGDDPTMYFQRLSADHRRGVIIIKRQARGTVTVHPKGLLPDERYTVSFQESAASETRTGADLMAKGIAIASMAPGELIYLNLPLHPGSKRDTTPPTAPSQVRKQKTDNLGYPGVELTWKAGRDDNWVSYYEVLRDGVVIEKVAHGTYTFDHSAGADLAALYEVRTVDGAGNASPAVRGVGPRARRAVVIDDTAGAIQYSGAWTRHDGLMPAHSGTISQSGEAGAAAEVAVEGGRALVFAKLGPGCGMLSVSVDGGPPELVDTYSADDIWGVCVWRRDLPAGRHTLRLTVAGKCAPRSSGIDIWLDGLRLEP